MKKNILLGINWEQNSTAALMIDGKIVGCSSEERFSKVKNDERYPKKSIDWLLKSYRIKPDQIDNVCFISNAWAPSYILTRHYTKMSIDEYIDEQNKIWYPKFYENNKKISQLKIFKNKLDLKQFPGEKFWKKEIKKYVSKNDHSSNKKNIDNGKRIRENVINLHLKIPSNKVKFIDHSSGHIFYSFFASNKNKKSLAISLDAFGDFVNYKAVILQRNRKKIVQKNIVQGSNFIVARLYRYVTLILGLKPNEHEYKVMGMAPYSKEKYYLDIEKKFFELQDVKNLKFFNKSKFKDLYFHVKKLLNGKRFDSISGGLQSYSEKLINKWVRNILKKKKISDICISGGVALNVKNNLALSKIKGIKNVFVPPSPDDSSQAMGACYYYYSKTNQNPKSLSSAYLGYEITEKNVKKELLKIDKHKYKIINNNINHFASKLINNNKIIARCSGKAEFGARALGNRSILANPQNINIKKVINEKIKSRDFWMPFATSVIEPFAKKYFDLNGNIENYLYMTNCADTKKKFTYKLAASIHPYDDTCRPHIVTKKQNINYYDLIYKFGKISNTYALLNTSFNLHGYPIVNNEKDALDIFFKTNLDAIILGNFLIIKK